MGAVGSRDLSGGTNRLGETAPRWCAAAFQPRLVDYLFRCRRVRKKKTRKTKLIKYVSHLKTQIGITQNEQQCR